MCACIQGQSECVCVCLFVPTSVVVRDDNSLIQNSVFAYLSETSVCKLGVWR